MARKLYEMGAHRECGYSLEWVFDDKYIFHYEESIGNVTIFDHQGSGILNGMVLLKKGLRFESTVLRTKGVKL